jgi:hypothetical protein
MEFTAGAIFLEVSEVGQSAAARVVDALIDIARKLDLRGGGV